MLVAVVLAWLNGLLIRMITVNVQFFGETADRSDYRVAAGAGLTTAFLLLLAMVALLGLAAPAWPRHATAEASPPSSRWGSPRCGARRGVEETVALRKSVWDGVGDVPLSPGSRPLLVLLVLAVVGVFRGRSSPAPR